MDASIRIHALKRGAPAEDYRDLAELLIDALDSGAGLSFLTPLPIDEAQEWWQRTVEESPERAVVLVARDGRGIIGTVQLQPAWAPNQPHRADVAKLIVHRRARGAGIANALMAALEREAIAKGFSLLVLDTVRGSDAERFYESSGWQRVGVVPNFALDPNGVFYCDTVFFYKSLASEDR